MKIRERGFTLVELLIVMAIFGLIVGGVSQMFVTNIKTFKQQGKMVETNIEGVIGLEILRRDLESADYGLPWIIPSGVSYQEAASGTAALYNDSPSNPPRPVTGGDGAGPLAGTDYLVVKAANVATNGAARKWNYLPPASPSPPTGWPQATENLNNTDWVTVISPGTSGASNPTLATAGTVFSWKYNSIPASLSDGTDTKVIYGIDTNAALPALRAPFNRADFYVKIPTPASNMPSRCAANTGILYKGTMDQSGGNLTELPLVDCVADMQVTYHSDTNADGIIDNDSNVAGPDAQTIRAQLKEIHVYILAQEGQIDTSYTYPSSTVLVGDSSALGRNFSFTTAGVTNWQNYRWKLYTLVVKFHMR